MPSFVTRSKISRDQDSETQSPHLKHFAVSMMLITGVEVVEIIKRVSYINKTL